jgi:hypothetical protein
MDTFEIQAKLFELIHEKIIDKSQWIEQVAETLSLSKPAVYKRVNGTTAISLHDLSVLMRAYDISFDALVHEDRITVDFNFPTSGKDIKGFIDFLTPIKKFVSELSLIPEVEIWHATSELHLFYYFLDKDLTNFKMFLHAKTIWNLEGYEDIKFSIDDFSGSSIIEKDISAILGHYFSVDNIELWNENIINNTLNQIKYFLISGYFQVPEHALVLCNKLRKLILHLRKMAETGKKIYVNKDAQPQAGNYNLYHNELSYTNNIMLILSPYQNYIFTTYNNPNFMISENEKLVEYTKEWFQRVKRMSQPVSLDASQSRMLLFNQIEKKIELTEKEIQHLIEKLS